MHISAVSAFYCKISANFFGRCTTVVVLWRVCNSSCDEQSVHLYFQKFVCELWFFKNYLLFFFWIFYHMPGYGRHAATCDKLWWVFHARSNFTDNRSHSSFISRIKLGKVTKKISAQKVKELIPIRLCCWQTAHKKREFVSIFFQRLRKCGNDKVEMCVEEFILLFCWFI